MHTNDLKNLSQKTNDAITDTLDLLALIKEGSVQAGGERAARLMLTLREIQMDLDEEVQMRGIRSDVAPARTTEEASIRLDTARGDVDLLEHAECARDGLIDALAFSTSAEVAQCIGQALVEVHTICRKLREVQS
jgi:hypothetical protein